MEHKICIVDGPISHYLSIKRIRTFIWNWNPWFSTTFICNCSLRTRWHFFFQIWTHCHLIKTHRMCFVLLSNQFQIEAKPWGQLRLWVTLEGSSATDGNDSRCQLNYYLCGCLQFILRNRNLIVCKEEMKICVHLSLSPARRLSRISELIS